MTESGLNAEQRRPLAMLATPDATARRNRYLLPMASESR
jgi:hypothetical protein